MPRIDVDDYLDDEIRRGARRAPYEKSATASAAKKAVRNLHAVLGEEAQKSGLATLGAAEAFTPSLGATDHELEWIYSYLAPFYESSYLVDVLRRVKGGKEANVYVCRAHPDLDTEFIAAKLYRPRLFRNLRNDSRYRARRDVLGEDGNTIHNNRVLHAVAKGSSYGKSLRQTSWMQHEYRTIEILYQAGLPVPRPFITGENAILMEYIGDLDLPAPALNEVHLPRQAVRRVFDTVIQAVEGMLACGRIHADLSSYNILYWQDRPVIIDFPQAIDPRQNPDSWPIFYRDVERICQYFNTYGLEYSPVTLARAIWARQNDHFQPEIPEADFVDDEEEAPE